MDILSSHIRFEGMMPRMGLNYSENELCREGRPTGNLRCNK